MPHSTRLSTPIPRSYISDPWLNGIDDSFAREFFLRAKLVCDNCGRLPGDAGTLAAILFPGVSLNRTRAEKILDALVKGRLIFHYQVGRQWFLEICDTGATQRLVGNMTDESEYPPPPKSMVDKWESFTGKRREVLQRVRSGSRLHSKPRKNSSNNVQTGSNAVHTGSNGSEQVSTGMSELSRVELSRVELSGEESDFAKSANAIIPSTVACAPPTKGKSYGEVVSDPRSFTDLHILTAGAFDAEVGFRHYKHKDEFLSVIVSCFEARRDIPLGGKPEAAEFMAHVVNACATHGFKAPRGWMRVLGELREETKVLGFPKSEAMQ